MRAIGEGRVFDDAWLVAVHPIGLRSAVGMHFVRSGEILERQAIEEREETVSLMEVIMNCDMLVLL